MSSVSIRYIANDVTAAVEFYTRHLDFELEMRPAPGFAALKRGDLKLLINAPGAGGAGASMADGTTPQPGGWNRFRIEVEDLASTVTKLRDEGAKFRNDIVEGNGGKQILLEDPSGNPIELFEPKR
jgi:catechol 2,3-dioxygenase-like lactoylglutathione lyase family enzyme